MAVVAKDKSAPAGGHYAVDLAIHDVNGNGPTISMNNGIWHDRALSPADVGRHRPGLACRCAGKEGRYLTASAAGAWAVGYNFTPTLTSGAAPGISVRHGHECDHPATTT